LYSNVGRTVNPVINPPATAASSKILVYPSTAGHGGGQQTGWTLTGTFKDAFKTVQRWIEEGGANN
jgi:hypothetical protein